MTQHNRSLLDCGLSFIYHMDVSTLSGVPDVFRRVANHFSLWTEMDVDDNTRAMCEDVRVSCRAVLQELNRILDENEQDEYEDSSESESDAHETAAQKAIRITDDRVKQIIASIGEPSVLPSEFLSLIEETAPISRQKMEDKAFIRLYRGYKAENNPDWTNALDPYSNPVQSYRTQVDATRGFETESLENRLVSRDAFIVSTRQELCTHSFLLAFIKQSEAVKFASDWKKKGQEPGGRTFKNAFARSIYFARTGHPPPSSDDPSEDQKNFKKFRAQQQSLITDRNFLLDMYNYFGVSIFLDPTWDIDKLKYRSKTFRAVFKKLCETETPRLRNNKEDNARVFKVVVDTLSRSDMSEYISHML